MMGQRRIAHLLPELEGLHTTAVFTDGLVNINRHGRRIAWSLGQDKRHAVIGAFTVAPGLADRKTSPFVVVQLLLGRWEHVGAYENA